MFHKFTDDTVVIVRGGSHQRGQSLRSGGTVFHALRKNHEVRDVHQDRRGRWHFKGKRVKEAPALQSSAHFVSTLIGDDQHNFKSTAQKFNASFFGSRHSDVKKAHDPHTRRKMLKGDNIPTRPHWQLREETDGASRTVSAAILQQITYPVTLDGLPNEFSRRQVTASSRPELREILEEVFRHTDAVTAYETKDSDTYSVMVVAGFRGQPEYAFPARKKGSDANPASPGLGRDVKKQLGTLAQETFRSSNLADIARIDILITKQGLQVADIDAHPRLDRHSLLADGAHDVGTTLADIFASCVKTFQTRC
jgi:D-alanine-D-alanine ligase-like ATP-grasp enzyme